MYASNEPRVRPCACTTVKKLSRVLGRTYDAALADAGINITQLAVLRCIVRLEGEPLVRVAEELELERTALYRALAPMIRDGWIVTSDTRPGNVKTAKITKKGRKLLTSVGRDWDGVQSELVKKFGAREFDALVGELYRLASCAETLNAQ